jgi:hypothetical protein
MEESFAGPSHEANRSRRPHSSRTQKPTIANTSNGSPLPSSSLSPSLLSGSLTDSGSTGVAGIDVALGGPLPTLRAMARAALSGRACDDPVCACQVAKADAPKSTTSTTNRGAAIRRAYPGGNILGGDPHRRRHSGCPSHATIPFPVDVARAWRRIIPGRDEEVHLPNLGPDPPEGEPARSGAPRCGGKANGPRPTTRGRSLRDLDERLEVFRSGMHIKTFEKISGTLKVA